MRWGVCDVGDVRCGGCAMRVDLCVGWLGWLISGFVNLLSAGGFHQPPTGGLI